MGASAGVEAQDGGAGEEQVRENTMRPTPRTDAAIESPMRPTVLRDAVDIARALERELAEAVELLEACVQAAAHDVVEDFSAVSNAADAAFAFLQRMEQAGRNDGHSV